MEGMKINILEIFQLLSLFSFRRSIQIAAISMAFSYASSALKGAAFHVEIEGQGQAVLMVPGLACSGEVWRDTVETLSKSYQCHVFTLPGFADQPAVQHDGSFVDFVKEELLTYIEENGLKSPLMIGHSLGGFIGLSIASETASPLSGLVVVDSLPFLPAMMNPSATEESMKSMAKGIVVQSQSMQPEQYRQMLATMITAPERIDEALFWSSKSDGATVSEAMVDLYTTDLRDDIANIDIPVLVMGAWVAYKAYGSTRESTMAIYNVQYAALPNYELKMTDIGKHFIMWDDPEFFLNETENFFGQL